MSGEKQYQPQSISISSSQVSGQIGMGGRDVIQSQMTAEEMSASVDVVAGLAQIEELIRSSDLSETQKNKVIRHIETTKEEAQSKEPQKDFAAANLKRATEVLKDADATVSAGQSLFSKVKPILESLLPWFGVAKSFFGL
jgi:predicted ribonuclease toxin of YeeF-YezG toxin-antitoxin module